MARFGDPPLRSLPYHLGASRLFSSHLTGFSRLAEPLP